MVGVSITLGLRRTIWTVEHVGHDAATAAHKSFHHPFEPMTIPDTAMETTSARGLFLGNCSDDMVNTLQFDAVGGVHIVLLNSAKDSGEATKRAIEIVGPAGLGSGSQVV